ncbi:MAG: hypothetical protein H7Z14_14335, partial [Anaerolineae bacterium]|nr:hypothetical protein [Phycisphaerae bacterium]
MDIAKKNLLSIICVVIAILAMVAVFVWPLPGKFAEIQAKADARKAEYESLSNLARKERKLPATDLAGTEQKVLGGFPTQAVIEKGNLLISEITTQSKSVQESAAKLNEHQLLVRDSLPTPGTSVSYKYQQEYQRVMDFANPDPAIRNQTIAVRILKAGVPPTEADITVEKERRKKEIEDNELIPGQNDAQVAARVAQMEATIGETLRSEIATKSNMYMNPDAMDIYPNVLGVSEPPKAEPIYYSQLGLWVQQDVCSALAAVNAATNAAAAAADPSRPTGILTSAVKHLIKIDVNEDSGKTSGG